MYDLNLDDVSQGLFDKIAGRWSNVRSLFVSMDLDGSGTIDRREWCMVLPVALNMVGLLSESELSTLFDHFDADQSGELEYKEIYHMLRLGSKVELDSRLKAGAVEFDRVASQRYKVRKEARSKPGANVLHGLVLGPAENGEDRDPEEVLTELGKALASKLGRIIDLFREWDEDGSGEIDKQEFCDAMESIGLEATLAERRALFDRLDEDRSGTIEYGELVKKLRRAARTAKRNRLRRERDRDGPLASRLSLPSLA